MDDALTKVFVALATRPVATRSPGLISCSRDAQRRPVHLEATVPAQATEWIEHYRRQAEARYRCLDAVLAEMDDDDEEPR